MINYGKKYSPYEDSTKHLILLFTSLIIWIVIIIIVLINVIRFSYYINLFFNWLFFFWIPLLLFITYKYKIGEFVIISNNGISRPMKIMLRKIDYISTTEILSFKKIYSYQVKNKIVGLTINLKNDKKYTYYENKTPGSIKGIQKFLIENDIREENWDQILKLISKYYNICKIKIN